MPDGHEPSPEEAGAFSFLCRGPFTTLRHRNYRLFWFGQLVSVTGTWVQSIAQAWLITRLADPTGTQGQGVTGWYLGLVGAAGSVPIFFGALFGGVVADRVDKRRLIIVTQTIMMLCAFTLALLVATHVVRIWHVMALAFCLGTATAFDLPARQAFVVDMVGKEDIGGAVALNSGLFNAARMMGPAITGFLLAARVSLAVCFTLNGLSFLAVIFGLWRMRMPAVRHVPRDQHVLQTIREGVAYVRHTPSVRRILVLVGAYGTFAFSFTVVLPAFVRYYLVPGLPFGVQGRYFGLLESTRGVGALAAALVTATLAKRGAQKSLLLFGAATSVSGLVLFSLMRSLVPAYLTIAVVSFAFVCCFASCNTLVQMEVPDALRGRVMSLYVLLNSGTGPVGSLMVGAVARHWGTPAAIRSSSFAAVSVIILMALLEIALRRNHKSRLATERNP